MTTEPETTTAVGMAKSLTEAILKGDLERAAASAVEMSKDKVDVNDLIDNISEAMSIASDLHEINKLTDAEVEGCEKAAEKSLEVLRPKIRVEQRKVSGRVMVASLEGDPHSFNKTLLIVMLEMGGFTALDGGSNVPPGALAEKAELIRPDVLAVPLVTESAAKNLAAATLLLSSRELRHRIVAYGRGGAILHEPRILVVKDALGALSRIAELLIAKG